MCRRFRCQQNGPNVNVKSLKVLQKQGEENSLRQLIDIGTCNIHGAFQAGAIATNTGLKSILKGAFYLLHDSPARRDDCTSVTGGDSFSPVFL